MGLRLWIKSLPGKFRNYSVSFVKSIDKPIVKKKRSKRVNSDTKEIQVETLIQTTQIPVFENSIAFDVYEKQYFNNKMKRNTITYTDINKTQVSGFAIAINIFSDMTPFISTEHYKI